MLVMISDIHFSDGTVGEKSNTPARAFQYLKEDLEALINNPRIETDIKELELVLLGDVFDLLRTNKWEGEAPMPWSKHNDALESRISEILDAVCVKNAAALAEIHGLDQVTGIEKASVTYVPGNHDRFLNWFPSTRQLTADAVGMQLADPDKMIPCEYTAPEYGVFARHGDIYDKSNWGGSYDKSCLGDAVVIKLMNGLPDTLAKHMREHGVDPESPGAKWVFQKTCELDHLRPFLAIPAWMQGLYAEIGEKYPDQATPLRKALKAAWAEAVHDFSTDDFVKSLNRPLYPELIDAFIAILHIPLGVTEKLAALIKKLNIISGIVGNTFSKAAAKESALGKNGIDSIVYGHTHAALELPLDIRKGQPLMYFNTGAWRKTTNQVAYPAGDDRKFIPWEIMAYLIFYQPHENRGHKHELWRGSRR